MVYSTTKGIFSLFAYFSMDEPLFPYIVRLRQKENGYPAIIVTLSGIVIRSNEKQPLNAISPIMITPLGIVTLFNEEQPVTYSRRLRFA